MLLATPLAGRELTGVVKHVQDGDSFILHATGGGEITVRLAECDAPERHQPYANESRSHLRKMIEGRKVVIFSIEEDRYGRPVGRVYRDEVDVNKAMVAAGYAWAHLKYLTDREFLKFEAEARQKRRGLWADRNKPVEPWVFREQNRRHSPAEDKSGSARPDNCDIKGNINAEGTKIYHLPGSRSYAGTDISPRKGERWFCSEEEAQAAGWRAAGRRN